MFTSFLCEEERKGYKNVVHARKETHFHMNYRFVLDHSQTVINTFMNKIIWPASREKGPSDITNSVDQDQPLHDVENSYT